jgi:hypothetical protein
VVLAAQSDMMGRGVGKGLSGLGVGRGSGPMSRFAGNLSIIVFCLGLGWGYGELYEFFFADDG